MVTVANIIVEAQTVGMNSMSMSQQIDAFYPKYLSFHQNKLNRIFHYCGTLAAVSIFTAAIVLHKPLLFIAVPFCGYGPAWIGHFVIEKNRPATFEYFWLSLFCDFLMCWHMLTGRLSRHLNKL
jgi:hypothetical protein